MASPESIRIELPASYKYLNVLSTAIGEMLARAAGPETAQQWAYGVQLATHEVCANIVYHSNNVTPGSNIAVTLQFDPDSRAFVVEIRDDGAPFDPSRVPEPDILQDRGRGLRLIRDLVDEVSYAPNSRPVQYHSRQGSAWQMEAAPIASQNIWRLTKFPSA